MICLLYTSGTVVGVATLPFVWSVAEEVSTEELVAASVVTAADVPVFVVVLSSLLQPVSATTRRQQARNRKIFRCV